MKITRNENGKLALEVENFEEVLVMSIKLVPGLQYSPFNSDEIYDLRIPSVKDFPEKCFYSNNGVYIFRYNGDVYLRRSTCFAEGYTSPFGTEFTEKCVYVPMSNGEIFVSPVLQEIWEQMGEFYRSFSNFS